MSSSQPTISYFLEGWGSTTNQERKEGAIPAGFEEVASLARGTETGLRRNKEIWRVRIAGVSECPELKGFMQYILAVLKIPVD